MSLDDLKLSLMAFPQRFDGTSGMLDVNLLMLPVGDPTQPLIGTSPKFAGTAVNLVVNIVSGTMNLPGGTTPVAKTIKFDAQPNPAATNLFDVLYTKLTGKPNVTVLPGRLNPGQGPHVNVRIKKALPPSYTQAFPFEGPRSGDISTNLHAYGCLLRNQFSPKAHPHPPQHPKDASIYWGQILNYALHQPVLAEQLGLTYKMQLPVPATLLAKGGFVYVTLDTSVPGNPWVSDYQLNQDYIKSYAAMLPALTPATKRQIFAARLLPVAAPPSTADMIAKMDEAQQEAEVYDDGFAQIVHTNQPGTIDAVSLDPDQIAPATDAGVQIGWDDEQVTIWLNNQLDMLRYRLDPGSVTDIPVEAPLGVIGYRVDVSLHTTTDPTWYSLCEVAGHLPGIISNPAKVPKISQELWVTPAPTRKSISNDLLNYQPAMLPLYFALWTGWSLVRPDPVVTLLAEAFSLAPPPGSRAPPPALHRPPSPQPPADIHLVPPLLYGKDYDIRVRLVDLTGGGPGVGDTVLHPGQAPQGLIKFRRTIPPKTLVVETDEASLMSSDTPTVTYSTPPATRSITTLEVQRPRIGYPEALFTGGIDRTSFSGNLIQRIYDAWNNGNSVVGIPDPDVAGFTVRVEARVPIHDITGIEGTDSPERDGNFRVIYNFQMPFPPISETEPDPKVSLSLSYQDCIDISTMVAPDNGASVLPVPTARNVRVRLFPYCDDKTDYYSMTPLVGPSTDFIIRGEAHSENDPPQVQPPITIEPEKQITALYFQPGSNIPQLLAQHLGLEQNGLTFSGSPGIRTVFGASGALKHHIQGDASSITFSNQTELVGQWVIALILDFQRDWTWDGFIQPEISSDPTIPPQCPYPPIQVFRDQALVGALSMPRVVATSALGDTLNKPDRTFTRIVFFDAMEPTPAMSGFPREVHPHYSLSINFASAAEQTYHLETPDKQLVLPITTPPIQTPKIVSTGIAESPYHHSADYSSTALRDRFLWIEFDEPIADPDNTYFGRVLAYGPDPLLASALAPTLNPANMLPESPEPALPVDPEPVRIIFAGQSMDDAGLMAMTEMIRSDLTGVGKSGKFFLLPLPPGLTSESLELFGFWTYEFRVGHAKLWSTAQGRFGRPLRITGLQHPSPHLICTVHHTIAGIEASAPYACTVYNGTRLYDFTRGDPQTQIWFMLYAQVLQADRASHRNILICEKEGIPVIARGANPPVKGQDEISGEQILQHSHDRDPFAGIKFTSEEILGAMTELGLSLSLPMSVLAVEILPGSVTSNVDNPPVFDAVALSETQNGEPLGANLGSRRILRTSPLTPVPPIC